MQQICHFYINVLCYSYGNINTTDSENNEFDQLFNRKTSSKTDGGSPNLRN